MSGGEYRLLRVFLDHPHRALSRDQLLNLTHGHGADQYDRSIDLMVSRLRQRLGDGRARAALHQDPAQRGLCVLGHGVGGGAQS
jgi:two-component system OmpR family response regulator